VRGGPEVQSATRRAGTVAPRLRGALILKRSIRQYITQALPACRPAGPGPDNTINIMSSPT
jgi:hypothetical protein